MNRTSKLVVLGLALLLVAAFFLHREPRPRAPLPPPERKPLPEVAVPAPEAPALASASPRAGASSRDAAAIAAAVPEKPRPGVVRGGVRILGVPPPRKVVKRDAEPQCQELHPEPLLADDLVVNNYGGIQWAFVVVKKGLSRERWSPPETTVELELSRCRFTPHVVGVQVGQALRIRSRDPFLHNAHGLTMENKEFNRGYRAGAEEMYRFDKPESPFAVKCDIHPWMRAFIAVVEHPFFCVTTESGFYEIAGLPPGRLTLQVSHEKFLPVSQDVEVPSGGEVYLDFVLDRRKE